jgi:hypothetical protein
MPGVASNFSDFAEARQKRLLRFASGPFKSRLTTFHGATSGRGFMEDRSRCLRGPDGPRSPVSLRIADHTAHGTRTRRG